MSDNKNVILFPSRKAKGETSPSKPNVWIERFGMWNYFLFVATIIGAGVVLLASVAMKMLGL